MEVNKLLKNQVKSLFWSLRNSIEKKNLQLQLLVLKSDIGWRRAIIWRFYSIFCQYYKWNKSKSSKIEYNSNGFCVIESEMPSELSANLEDLNVYISKNLKKEETGLYYLKKGAAAEALITFIRKYFNLYQQQIEETIGSYFQIYRIHIYKTVPIDERTDMESSFAWHYDSTPYEMTKLFIYLDDTTIENGAFCWMPLSISRSLYRKGFVSSKGYRTVSQCLIGEKELESVKYVEGIKGSSFIFNNGTIHKATFPIKGQRTVIGMEIFPSHFPLKYENIHKSIALLDDKKWPAFPAIPWKNRYI